MEFQRTQNSTRNLAFGITYKVMSLLMPFAIRTIIVYKLGADYLGLTSLFTSILTMLNMTELGIGSAITFCLYKPVAEDDTETVCALLNLLKKLYNLIGIITLSVGLILMPFLSHFISKGYPADINIYILYGIYLFQTVVSYLMYSYKNVLLEVYQRTDIVHKINTVIDLIKYIIQIVILFVFEDYYIYALALPVAQVAVNLVINRVTNKTFPNLHPKGEVPRETKIIIRNKVLFLSAHSITSKFTNSIDNIVISASLGLVPIALYGNYTYIYSAILSFVMIAYQAVKASVGNIMNTSSKEQNRRLYESLSFLSWWGSSVCTICLLCLYQPFMELWLGKDYLLSDITMVWCCLYFYVNCQRQFLTMVYIGTSGLWNKTLLRQILVTISNLMLDILLVKPFGVAGIIFASVFTHAMIGLPLDVKVVFNYILQEPVRIGLRKMVLHTISLFILGGVTYWLTSLVPSAGIAWFIARCILAFLIPNLAIVLIKFRSEEFDFVWQHIKVLMRR